MDKLLQKIRTKVLTFKVQNIKNKLKNISKKLNPSGKKTSKEASLSTFSAESQKQIDEIKESISVIIKSVDNSPEKLLQYIQAAKTPIYRIKNARKMLQKIGEEIGFITYRRGLRALYLSLLTQHKFSLKTESMFVLDSEIPDIYTVIHNFYLWYSYKSGLAGFEYKVQNKFKQYMLSNSKPDVSGLNLDEIDQLQEAIKRDQEATDFVLNYAKQLEGSQKVMDEIKNSGSADV